jgi:AbrB family looped-hinge helix DNA binding protein
MPTATVTSKGQITIPVEVREALKLKPGEKVIFFPWREWGVYRTAGRLDSGDAGLPGGP